MSKRGNILKKWILNADMFKGILAGFAIALGALAFGVISTIGGTLGFKTLGAFLFSMGLCAVFANQLNLVTGKFGKLYDGSWCLRQILLIFVANLFGVFLLYCIRQLDATSNLVVESMAPIVAARDSKIWYQHIFSGVICGACIQFAVYNYSNNNSYLSAILPVMMFILIGGEHCIADTFYYMWSPWSLHHALAIGLVFIGNLFGAILVVVTNSCTLPHLHL